MSTIEKEVLSYHAEVCNSLDHYNNLLESATLSQETTLMTVYREVVFQLGLVKFKLEKIIEKAAQHGETDKLTRSGL